MKRILQLISILSLVFAFNSAIAQAKIVFEQTSHNFGTISETGGRVTTTFTFTNQGDAPLILSNVRASCGCTTPKWTREPVAPKTKGSINVTYNPKHRPGSFHKSITVSSNASNNTVVLHISGKVETRPLTLAEQYPRKIGSLRAKSNNISFAKITKGSKNTKTLELINDTDNPQTVTVKRAPKFLTTKIEPSEIPAHGKSTLTITYDTDQSNTYGFVSNSVYLSINGSNNYKTPIRVGATIEEDFSKLTPEELANAPVVNFAETSFDFGEIKQGEKKTHTFTLKNDGKSALYIRNIKTSCGCTAAGYSKKAIAAGESTPIKITFNSRGKRGRQSKSITVITNDPKNSTSRLRITSNVIVPTAE